MERGIFAPIKKGIKSFYSDDSSVVNPGRRTFFTLGGLLLASPSIEGLNNGAKVLETASRIIHAIPDPATRFRDSETPLQSYQENQIEQRNVNINGREISLSSINEDDPVGTAFVTEDNNITGIHTRFQHEDGNNIDLVSLDGRGYYSYNSSEFSELLPTDHDRIIDIFGSVDEFIKLCGHSSFFPQILTDFIATTNYNFYREIPSQAGYNPTKVYVNTSIFSRGYSIWGNNSNQMHCAPIALANISTNILTRQGLVDLRGIIVQNQHNYGYTSTSFETNLANSGLNQGTVRPDIFEGFNTDYRFFRTMVSSVDNTVSFTNAMLEQLIMDTTVTQEPLITTFSISGDGGNPGHLFNVVHFRNGRVVMFEMNGDGYWQPNYNNPEGYLVTSFSNSSEFNRFLLNKYGPNKNINVLQNIND